MKSFVNYMLFSKSNYLLLPLCILFFVLTEICFVIYSRLLLQYDKMVSGNHETTFNKMGDFWIVLSALLLGNLAFYVIKCFLLAIVILKSNQEIHTCMINKLVRSPASYFDVTSTGELSNKLSNDLGIIDNTIVNVLVELMEGPIQSFILLVSIATFDAYLLIPGALSLAVFIYFYIEGRKAIVAIKEFDLKLKSPVFQMIG